MDKKTLQMVTFTLLVVGGVNWGLEALGYNLVTMLLGEGSTLTRIVYALVGLSAVYTFVNKK